MFYKNMQNILTQYKAGQLNTRSLKKFLLIVCSITGVYLIAASVVTASLLAAYNRNLPVPSLNHNLLEIPDTERSPSGSRTNNQTRQASEEDEGNFLRPPSRTNVLILGIDNVNLADVIILGSFARDTGDVNLLHIPRDTFTRLPQHRMDSFAAVNRWVPSSGIMKLNAVRSLGREYGLHFMREHLSEELGIEIHYHVEISIAAFREIVDLIGGVEIEVPRHMFYIDDCQHPPVIIDIPAGLHLMDGHMAEQFVRYREYPDADLGRINAQQQFMTQLFRQALRRENIMRDPVGMARIAIHHVQTDIGLDLFRYIPYVGNLSPERIFTYTLPGEERRIHGASMYVPDGERVFEVINRMFFGITAEDEAEEVAIAVMAQADVNSSQDARIAVLNGSRIGGLARNIADKLYFNGYQIAHVGVYSGAQEYRTRIRVREEGLGEDLLQFFKDASIRVDSRMPADFDIVIVVGRSEQ